MTEIEHALAYKGPRLRFVPCLEKQYEEAQGAIRNRAVATYLVVYLAAKMLFLLANLQIGWQVFKISMLLRLGIVLPLTVVSVWLLLRPMPRWVHAAAAFAPLIAETALVMILGRMSGSAVSARYVIAAGVGIFAQTLLMRAPFRQCLCGLIVALAVFCTLSEIRWPGHFGPPVTHDYLIFVTGFCLPALYERHSRERTARRVFLLDETNRMRIDDILRMNEHLERLSSLDSLTGLFNRRYLDAALSRSLEVAIKRQRWMSLLLIDIDHFKAINDTEGHPYGDLCLEKVASVLQSSVRAGVDTVARYGGEEFLVILPDADDTEAVSVGERVRQSVEAAGLPSAHGRVVTISAGATAVQGGASPNLCAEDIVAVADRALYEAKQSGRNRVVYSHFTHAFSATGSVLTLPQATQNQLAEVPLSS